MDSNISPDRTTCMTGPSVGVGVGVEVCRLGGRVTTEPKVGRVIGLTSGVDVGWGGIVAKALLVWDGGIVGGKLYRMTRITPSNKTMMTLRWTESCGWIVSMRKYPLLIADMIATF